MGELVPCTEGDRGNPDHPSPALAKGWLYMPIPAASGAVEIAHGQNPLANKPVLFSVGKQEFRREVWQEACTLGI